MHIALAEMNLLSPGGMEILERRVDRITADASVREVRVDFGGVHFVSTQVLGQLLRLHKRLSDREGRVTLHHLEPNIREVFHISRLEIVFKLDDGPTTPRPS